jgi:hypothetical protein
MSNYAYAPSAIRTLPFTLRRSHLFPVNPPLFAQGVAEYEAGEVPVAYLPQKMGFTRYTTPGATFAANAAGVVAASDVARAHIESIVGPIEAGKGVYTPEMAAQTFNQLPAPIGLHGVRRFVRRLSGLGAPPELATEAQVFDDAQAVPAPSAPLLPGWRWALGALGLGLGLYHGWHRTKSTGWSVVWGFAGATFPIIALPLAAIQGFAKPAKR